MKHFIFYTSQGFTEDMDCNQTENCQVLGWGNGKNPEDAFEKLKTESGWVGKFDHIACQELSNENVYYF